MAGGCGHPRLEGSQEQLECHGCVLWELELPRRQLSRDSVQGRQGGELYPGFSLPPVLSVHHCFPSHPLVRRQLSWGLRRQPAEASPLATQSKTQRSRRMGQDKQTQCTSHGSQGRRWAARFAPGLSHLGPGPPGPRASCLCPPRPRLSCPSWFLPLSPQRSKLCL